MSDHHNSLISSFLGSPRFFFNGFFAKSSETACNNNNLMSPTSVLDIKNSSIFTKSDHHHQQAIGLALIDSFIHEGDGEKAENNNRMVLFGSKLKIRIPDPIISPEESPKSPADFGIKTRNVSQVSITPNKEFSRQLSLKEMELSEDYTRVITHGPNPKTTHIYDDCVVESSDGIEAVSDQDKGMEFYCSASTSFMSFCHTCNQVLGQGRDIFIYRGEKAFCSEDCRCQEMVSEGTKNAEFEWCFLGPSK